MSQTKRFNIPVRFADVIGLVAPKMSRTSCHYDYYKLGKRDKLKGRLGREYITHWVNMVCNLKPSKDINPEGLAKLRFKKAVTSPEIARNILGLEYDVMDGVVLINESVLVDPLFPASYFLRVDELPTGEVISAPLRGLEDANDIRFMLDDSHVNSPAVRRAQLYKLVT